MGKRLRNTMRSEDAQSCIKNLAGIISKQIGTTVEPDEHVICGEGNVKCGVQSKFNISIGVAMPTKQGLLSEKVDTIYFLNIVRAMFHEKQHVVQHCKNFQSKNPEEEDIIMAVRNLAGERNATYYKEFNQYNNDLSEIDAELTALADTYAYVCNNFSEKDADARICDLVNYKTATSDYFIKGRYKSFDDITKAFLERYDDAQHAQIAGYIAWALRPSQDYNPEHDECIRYLQSCVRENPEEMKLLTQFNSVSDPHQKDLMMASIVCHLHPEIEYERVYPCLSDIDLSPENIFDRELPQPPEGLIKPIPKEDIERRIELAKFIHDKIVESEMRRYSDGSKSHKKEVLNESLVSERESEKTDEYGFIGKD